MTDKNEQISALMDNETSEPNTLDRLVDDNQAQTKWRRYHLISDTLKDDSDSALPQDFSLRVMAALEQEPTLLSPLPQDTNKLQKAPGKVISMVRNVVQYGIAATVAAAMVLGVQHFNQPQIEQPFSAARVPQIPGVSGGMAPVSLDTRTLTNDDTRVIEQKRRLNSYLNDHREALKQRPSPLQYSKDND
jgi:sigma-E factor negative regulatory protein RseA